MFRSLRWYAPALGGRGQSYTYQATCRHASGPDIEDHAHPQLAAVGLCVQAESPRDMLKSVSRRQDSAYAFGVATVGKNRGPSLSLHHPRAQCLRVSRQGPLLSEGPVPHQAGLGTHQVYLLDALTTAATGPAGKYRTDHVGTHSRVGHAADPQRRASTAASTPQPVYFSRVSACFT